MDQPSVHVEYTSTQWRVRVSTEAIARSHHVDSDDAVRVAKALAEQLGADLVVHRLDGTISQRFPRESPRI